MTAEEVYAAVQRGVTVARQMLIDAQFDIDNPSHEALLTANVTRAVLAAQDQAPDGPQGGGGLGVAGTG